MAPGGTPTKTSPGEASADSAEPEEHGPAEPPMAAVPVLASIAAFAALVELFAGRFGLRMAADQELSGLTHGQLLQIDAFATLARNLGAVAALVALGASLADWIKPRPFLSMTLRIAIAAIAGVLMPTLVLATVMPVERTTVIVVLVATGSAHVLAVLFGVGALPWRAPRAPRFAVTGIVGASFFAFSATVVLLIGHATLWQHAHPLGMALRRTGEVSFLLAVPLLAATGLPLRDGWRKLAVPVGAIVALSLLLALGTAGSAMESEAFSDVMYGATHFELFLEGGAHLYLGWLGLTLTLGIGALFARETRDRQKGLAALLLMAGGFAPTMPATLIPMILGVSLACRALITHAARTPAAELPRPEPASSTE